MSTEIKEPLKIMFSTIGQPSYVRPAVREIKFNGGFQSYGEDNKYPEYLLNIYFGSSQHQGIVQRKVDEIIGNGVVSKSNNPDLKKFISRCNAKGQDLYEVFRKVVNDNEIIGGFALQIVYGMGSTVEKPIITDLYYIDISKLRFNKNYTQVLYSTNWHAGSRVKVIKYDLYDPNDPTGSKVFYYSGTMTRDWYPIPQYVGSIPAIETAIEIANFNKQTLMNGFFPSMLVNFSGTPPTEEEKGGIERLMLDKWSGSNNSGRVVFSWSGPNDQPPTLQPITQPDLDKLFVELKQSVIEDIFIGHRITDPSLFGLAVAGKLGGQKDYNQSYAIFQQVYVRPARRNIFNVLNAILEPIMPNADLESIEIEPINNVFTDEALIASQMSSQEIRAKLKDMGYVDSVDLPKGQVPIITVDQPTPADGTPPPEIKIKVPAIK